MAKTEIEYDNLSLIIDYDVFPSEERNHGHPDDRLPDVEEEFSINDIIVVGWDIEEIKSLVKERECNE